MSYAIGTIIYGVPVTERLYEVVADLENETALDEIGFELLYTASGSYQPGYCGVKLKEFDECADFHVLTELMVTATDEQREQAKAMIEALPEAIRDELAPISYYVIWSSS